MKRGRPRKTDKAINRMHSVILDEVAEKVYRKINNARNKKGWLHEYVSEHIKKDFLPNINEGLIKQELLETEAKRDACEKKMIELAYQLKQVKIKTAKREVNQMIHNNCLKPINE